MFARTIKIYSRLDPYGVFPAIFLACVNAAKATFKRRVRAQNPHLINNAYTYYAEHNYRAALGIAFQLAYFDHGLAIVLIGNCYELGNGVKRDREKAKEYYLRAAELGEINGHCELAKMALINDNNHKQALLWLRRAFMLKQDRVPAKLRFIFWYTLFSQPIKTSTDIEEMNRCMEKISSYKGRESLYNRAMINWIQACQSGITSSARSDFVRAGQQLLIDSQADSDHIHWEKATFLLGILFLYGGVGFKQDLNKAKYYFKQIRHLNDAAVFYFLFIERMESHGTTKRNKIDEELRDFVRSRGKPLIVNPEEEVPCAIPLTDWSHLDFPQLFTGKILKKLPEHYGEALKEFSENYLKFVSEKELEDKESASASAKVYVESKDEKQRFSGSTSVLLRGMPTKQDELGDEKRASKEPSKSPVSLVTGSDHAQQSMSSEASAGSSRSSGIVGVTGGKKDVAPADALNKAASGLPSSPGKRASRIDPGLFHPDLLVVGRDGQPKSNPNPQQQFMLRKASDHSISSSTVPVVPSPALGARASSSPPPAKQPSSIVGEDALLSGSSALLGPSLEAKTGSVLSSVSVGMGSPSPAKRGSFSTRHVSNENKRPATHTPTSPVRSRSSIWVYSMPTTLFVDDPRHLPTPPPGWQWVLTSLPAYPILPFPHGYPS